MTSSLTLTAWILIIGVSLALVVTAIALITRVSMKPRRIGGLVAVLPNLLMLALFYSLAAHMWLRLWAWPAPAGRWETIALLKAHAYVARWYWAIQLLLTGTVLPIALLLCALVRRWRGAVVYLGIYVVAYVISWGIFLLAPSGFLVWWWD
jgi:hypothetical protein